MLVRDPLLPFAVLSSSATAQGVCKGFAIIVINIIIRGGGGGGGRRRRKKDHSPSPPPLSRPLPVGRLYSVFQQSDGRGQLGRCGEGVYAFKRRNPFWLILSLLRAN